MGSTDSPTLSLNDARRRAGKEPTSLVVSPAEKLRQDVAAKDEQIRQARIARLAGVFSQVFGIHYNESLARMLCERAAEELLADVGDVLLAPHELTKALDDWLEKNAARVIDQGFKEMRAAIDESKAAKAKRA